jgi:hypothetical protein
MRAILIGLLLAGSALGQPDALKAYKAELKRLHAEENKFWRAFQGRFTQALITFRQELELADAKPHEHKEATWDYTDFRSLYGDYAAIQESNGRADLALAESGHAKAAETLLKQLFGLIKDADKLEQELAEAKPKARYYVFDQRMGVRRHGLGLRQLMLIQALAKCADPAAFLASQGWKRAEKGDGKRSVSCRVAIMDALALTKDDAARSILEPGLKERLSSLRIAAAEALLGFGPESRKALEPLLHDQSAIVQRALIRGIRFRCAKDAGWIPPMLQAFRGSTGLVRDEALRTLEALTNQRFGYSPEKWKEWFEEYRKEIESGKFKADQVEVQEVERVPAPATLSFYGVRTPSRGVVFVLEGSQHSWMPSDWEYQRTKFRDLWRGTRTQWQKECPSHQEILLREFDRTLDAFPADARFGVVALQAIFGWGLAGEKKLLKPTTRDRKEARKLLERLPGRGWCSQFQGIRLAAALGGLDPESTTHSFKEPTVDTVFVWDSGDPSGGRYMDPDAVIAAFKRFNRFRRLVVHTLRICNEKEPSERLMKGLAEASGGRYVWLKKPPG